ncbi:hypothetical protein ATY75_12075 [Rhizobium sp. N122]|uniref:hypothetical protein n=1 Tax=Rhizobium sp. N122 TaxID=1764272 RepID=UPI000B5A2DD2|nr:hypothetical protein [Rhizobium sp. N122]OWV62554.1 hypothetical protein ATY75_12075 [Rhizobium sp. N122]
MKPTLSPEALSARVGSDTRHARVVGILCAVYPKEISASNLMVRAGLQFHADRVAAFTQLCISVAHINSRLPHRVGWKIDRTGGTPNDFYRLAPAVESKGDAA